MTRIATRVHRPKRPPRKRKPVECGAVVRRAFRPVPTLPAPANDDDHKPPLPPPSAPKPAIVTTTSRKRARLLRAEREGMVSDTTPDDSEAGAAMRAWLERAKWGHGPER